MSRHIIESANQMSFCPWVVVSGQYLQCLLVLIQNHRPSSLLMETVAILQVQFQTHFSSSKFRKVNPSNISKQAHIIKIFKNLFFNKEITMKIICQESNILKTKINHDNIVKKCKKKDKSTAYLKWTSTLRGSLLSKSLDSRSSKARMGRVRWL